MSIFRVKNGQLERKDVAAASQLIAVDTDNILGGGAGATTNTQALLDGISSDLSDYEDDMDDTLHEYHVVPSKNRAIQNGTRQTLASVTYTEEENGVIDVNGTATGSNSFYYISEHLEWPNEQMVLSGCPSGGDASTYRLIIASSEDSGASVYASDTGSGVIIPANTGGSTVTLDIYIRVAQNASVSHKKFYPMLCSKTEYDADPTYEPYYVCMRDGKLDIADYAKTGAVNYVKNTASSATLEGVAWTVNADGTVSATNQATALSLLTICTITENHVGERLYLSGCTGGSASTYDLYIVCRNSSNTALYFLGQYDEELEFIVPDGTVKIELYARVQSGYNPNGKLFKPMLSPIKGAPYTPYAMTNRELTEKVAVKTGTVTSVNQDVTVNSSDITKKAGTVTMTVTFTVANALSSGVRPLSFPDGFRPTTNLFCPLLLGSSPFSVLPNNSAYLGPNYSQVEIEGALAAGKYILTTTYVRNDL